MSRVTAAIALAWRACWWATIGSVGLAVIGGALPVAATWATRGLIDAVAGAAPSATVIGFGALLLGAVGLVALLLPLSNVVGQELRRRLELHMQRQLFAAVNTLPDLASFERPSFHDTLRLAQVASFAAPARVLSGGTSLARALVGVAGFGVTLAILGPLFAVVAFAAAGPVLINELRMARKRTRLIDSLSQSERRRAFYGELMSNPRAVKEIRLFGAGEHLLGRMTNEYRTIASRERAQDGREFAAQAFLVLPSIFLTAVAILLCINGARQGRLSPGDVAAVLAGLTAIQASTGAIAREIGAGYQSLAQLRHYLALTAKPPSPQADRLIAGPLRSGIELRDVWFRYGDGKPWVLSGVNLFIPAGRELALVGLNGSGKSTLVKLLCGLYQPVRGSITWDDIDYRELDPASVQARISTVFQDFMEYDLSAGDNIGIAAPAQTASEREIAAAARVAGIDRELESLPAGYRTFVSKRFDGVPAGVHSAGETTFLSGGQWQRVAIARASVRTSVDLTILDEPSSALDPEAEGEIHQRLQATRQGRTSVLISHRLNTVRFADAIAVLHKGQLVELGTHDELMARDGRYAKLFVTQAASYQDSRVGAAS